MEMDGTPIEAVVRTAEGETRYRGAGTGGPVLLLRASPSDHPDPLFHELSRAMRVVAPLTGPPTGREAAERWIEGIIEGLGLHRPEVVADAVLAPLLVRLPQGARSLVARVTFLPADGAAEPGPARSLPPGPSTVTHRP
jgi:hypothetical protein